jgi:DNA-binding CsgD family transcriptional regulator
MRPLGPTPALARGPRLLEREREVALLDALIGEAAEGQGRLALVEGPAGIGKSLLVAETRRRAAERGLTALTARSGELEREFPFGVVRQLFEPPLLDAEVRARALAGAAGAARAVFESLGGPGEEAIGDTSFAALHGLYWLTVDLSGETPLVIAIDDLHWCDRPSLRFLAYLLRRLEGLPVLLVCSLRPAEPGADAALLAEIAADPLAVSVRLGPLSPSAVDELVRSRLGEEADDAFARACHAATAGNPLLLQELLRALDAEGVRPDRANVETVASLGPRAASRAVLLRLARLPAEAVAVARATAVLGDGAELAAVAELAGLDEREAARTTAALVRAEILRADPPLGFVHTLVRDAVYYDLAPAERELHHERAARLLADSGGKPEQVAAHLLAIPPRSHAWVVETLCGAARAALQKGAAESAVAYLTRALREPPDDEERAAVLFALGRAEALTSGPSAAEHLRAAYDAHADPADRGRVAVVLARTLLFTGRAGEAASLAQRASAQLGEEQVALQRQLDALRLSLAFFDPTAVASARVELEQYRADPLEPGPEAKMLAALAAYHWAMDGGDSEECAALALRALAGGDLIEADNGGGPLIAAIIVLALADRDEALEACDAALADAHGRGSLFAAAAGHLFRGLTLLRRGELADAEEMLRTGLDEVRMWGPAAAPLYPGMAVPLRMVVSAAFLSEVLLERGDLDGARSALDLAGIPSDPPENSQVGPWVVSRIRVLLREGRFQEALDAANECARRLGHVFRNPGWLPWRSLAAEALAGLERRDEALERALEELELARCWGAPGVVGRALRVLGTIEGDAGIARLQEAVDVLAGSPARLEEAKALAALGAALRRAGRQGEAREPLRRALELADAAGAGGLAEDVRAELYASGARPRAAALGGVQALTASEQRVASLAAEGQSNRDIAQALFVTPKTVEVHLSNAYRKLGIRSRRELANRLATA